MKQAIVLTSFGAMGDDSRKLCLDALEADFRAEFPGAVIVQAFTSKFIRASLEKRGLHVDSLEEALERLAKEDVTHVLVQPTYMTPGEEYEKKGQWQVSAEDIERYREYAQYLVPMRSAIWNDGGYSQISQYMDGAITAKQLCSEMEKTLQMQRLEGQ